MKNLKSLLTLILVLVLSLSFTACDKKEKNIVNGPVQTFGKQSNKDVLRIISGSENKELSPIFERFAKDKNIGVEITYAGSLDIMRELGNDNTIYDAVWPASSLWISMGDSLHRVKHTKSISLTPVVFGIRKSLAESLGFIRDDVKMADILEAIKSGKLKFCMTSATQSNSGASAYISFLSGLSGSPDVLTLDHLNNDKVKEDIKNLLAGVDRSSGSSEWLKTLFLKGGFDAMVNYESLIITTNQELVAKNEEPLYVVYPVDGLAVSDAPLAFVAKSDNKDKENLFKEFQNYLLEDRIQKEIQRFGRRTGISGVAEENKKVFNKDWGVNPDKVLTAIKTPSGEVIKTALDMYQTEFKKPALNIYVLDYSGSMGGSGYRQLKDAMRQVLIQENAKKNLLQASSKEENILILFDDSIVAIDKASGNGAELDNLFKVVESNNPRGATDIYGACIKALEEANQYDLNSYSPAIIVMTDGEHNGSTSFTNFSNEYNKLTTKIPVFTILFGEADEKEMNNIAEHTKARVFDGRKNLIDAFKNVKGYN